jgi:hypothetical protein
MIIVTFRIGAKRLRLRLETRFYLFRATLRAPAPSANARNFQNLDFLHIYYG